MPRRILLRSLALTAILGACFAHLIWNGWHAKRIVAENLSHPALSSGKRDIDLWHPTASPGHVYDFTWAWPEDKPWNVPEGSRLEVQLASGGRTRLLVVQPGHPTESPSWWDVLRRRHRLQIVGDREWIDLGPLPAEGTRLEMQVYGLLPGPFAFAEPNGAGPANFSTFFIRRPDSPRARPSRTIVRYRFRVSDPIPAAETLARFFFFISCSRVLQVTGIAALALLFAGWWWLWENRAARAVACLVPAVTLLHACCLAPFQGADSVTHSGTVEAVVMNPSGFSAAWHTPASIIRAYDAIGYEDFVGRPDVPVPGVAAGKRSELRSVLTASLLTEASLYGRPLPDAFIIDPAKRAPLYYNSFRLAAFALRRCTILDRISLYVLLSAVASLLMTAAGLAVLARPPSPDTLVLGYGLICCLPYSVGVVASCSNYSLAIGIGNFIAACAVAALFSWSAGTRASAPFGYLIVASIVGIFVWDDFVFVGAPAAVLLLGIALVKGTRAFTAGRRGREPLAWAGAAAVMIVAPLLLLRSGLLQRIFTSFGARVPAAYVGLGDPTVPLILAAAVSPVVVSLLFVLFMLRSGSGSGRGAKGMWSSLGLLILFLLLFAVTPYTTVPFETIRLDLADELVAHWKSFWSNNFSWDQDRLFWKMYWGVFGYADVEYPPLLYAIPRWVCVAACITLPALTHPFTGRHRKLSAILLMLSGTALSICVGVNAIRYLGPSNPWGRYILPYVSLFALPALARITVPDNPRVFRLSLAGVMGLHIWTALTLLGTRYAVGL